ncbi:hypothetical protein JOE66_000558 [Subtercola frigoramans]|uniref:Major facilitator superfamily (MFS) profile domain-containing protein n=1 Tax=Subtercola frigoramans TaxID=120298 RepID=A0ABS2L1G9_9MICO|nr:hypothetical protein [Subtercola frigoramans]
MNRSAGALTDYDSNFPRRLVGRSVAVGVICSAVFSVVSVVVLNAGFGFSGLFLNVIFTAVLAIPVGALLGLSVSLLGLLSRAVAMRVNSSRRNRVIATGIGGAFGGLALIVALWLLFEPVRNYWWAEWPVVVLAGLLCVWYTCRTEEN